MIEPYFEMDLNYIPPYKKIIYENNKMIIYEDGSIYHKDNRLNNLTNKEWMKFTKSWFILETRKKRDMNILQHPATFPDELALEFIKFFTKEGAIVLDPMVGAGSTLVACVEAGRNGIGIDLNEKYARIAKNRLLKYKTDALLPDIAKKVHITYYVADAFDIDKLNLPQIDYCITSPPYWDVLRDKGLEKQKKRKEMGLDTYYSDDERDLGNISDYNEFLDKLTEIYRKVYDVLKPGAYMTVIVKNIKKKEKKYPLAWDLAFRLSAFFALKDEKIWCLNEEKLGPYGYKYAWSSNTIHHYCLNFRKET